MLQHDRIDAFVGCATEGATHKMSQDGDKESHADVCCGEAQSAELAITDEQSVEVCHVFNL